MRPTRSGVVSIMAGCMTCHGGNAAWTAKNALAVAARHHDATGHVTWCEAVISTKYGVNPAQESTIPTGQENSQ